MAAWCRSADIELFTPLIFDCKFSYFFSIAEAVNAPFFDWAL